MFKLQPNPTFRAKVAIPVPGEASVKVEFEFRHKPKDDLLGYLQATAGREDLDVLLDVVVRWWEVDEDFSREALGKLLQNYPGSGPAIIGTYAKELADARLGN